MLIRDFYKHIKANCTSENYQNQNPKAMIVFAYFIDLDLIFLISKVKTI